MTRSIASSKSSGRRRSCRARREQRRLVDEVGEVGAGEAGGPRAMTFSSTSSATFTVLA
jgi:hypothetical protein